MASTSPQVHRSQAVVAAVEDTTHRTRASSSTATGSHSPPSNPLLDNAQETGASTLGGANDAQEPATASPAISQRLWNEAYDRLKSDEEELVRSYAKTLKKILHPEASKDPASDVDNTTAELEDPSQRQIFMQKFVKEGREKLEASKTSKFTKGVGDFTQAILNVKPMVDLAIQNIPQAAPAALPWAGVCIGLQVSLHPSVTLLLC